MAVTRSKPWQHAQRRYGLRGWRRWSLWWLLAPLLLTGGVMLLDNEPATRTAGQVLGAVALLALGAWEWLLRRTALLLSAQGVQLRQLGYTLQTPWHNVTGFHAEALRQGFVLAQPLDGPGARRLAGFSGVSMYEAPLHAGLQAELLAARRFIPIEAFAWHLQHGTLRAEVAALAPHLATAMNAPHSATHVL